MGVDVVVVGGGLGGSVLAANLAAQGKRVQVLERETKFKDRVRGENMLPWGVAAARRMGIADELVAAGALQAPFFTMYQGGQAKPRPLPETTPHREPCLNMYHPDLQETLLARAAAAGADVRRGVVVEGVEAGVGRSPRVTYSEGGERKTVEARLVVGADGRSSKVREWTGFAVQRDPELLSIAGTLLEGTPVPTDATHLVIGQGTMMLMAPLGAGRARTYFVYPSVMGKRGLSGPAKVPELIDLCRQTGAPAEWLDGVTANGPLAEFVGADTWAESPAKHGVALVGDAAASTDPCFGCGLSLTLYDVESLTKALSSTDDWDVALASYAADHDRYYGNLHRILGWMTRLFWTPPPEGDVLRAKVMPRMEADPTGFPDAIGLGPDGPCDEAAGKLITGQW